MLYSTMPLAPASRAALHSMNIVTPTPIQEQVLPVLLAGRDLIGQARTGSGKTLAFALPLVEKVDPLVRAVQALVLVPTRELAQQVGEVVDTLARGQRLKCVRIFGGRAMGPQVAALAAGPHIVVGTPGRVLDLLRQEALHLDQVRYFVLDEADEMLDRGFAPDVERILKYVPTERQTVLLSATVPEWVQGTAAKHLKNPAVVQIDTRPEDVPKIEHVLYDVPEGQKLSVLRVLLDGREADESVLVFGRTKHGVKKLAKQLVALGYPAAALQGNLSQNARDAVMADFRASTVPILLATNVAARGLDVEHIGLVINYELPETPELLTHRVGRTGRMGREGNAITLLEPSDESKWRQLSRGFKLRLPRRPWEGDLPAIPAAVQAVPLYPRAEPPVRRPAEGSSRVPSPTPRVGAGVSSRVPGPASRVVGPRPRVEGDASPRGQRPASVGRGFDSAQRPAAGSGQSRPRTLTPAPSQRERGDQQSQGEQARRQAWFQGAGQPRHQQPVRRP
ncbi:MAG: DEAD/DEAH box helicase [Chloroflexota bacterium]